MSQIPTYINLWLEVGLCPKNRLWYIDVNKSNAKIRGSVFKELPAYHAFTGSDYTAPFSRKGNVRPLKYLKKYETIQDIFTDMGYAETVSEKPFNKIECYACIVYRSQSWS